ncbi:MAG: glycosyltransferase family 4 protein, partial [Acidobacteriota bacterium]
ELAMEGGAPASRVHVIPNGFDPDLIPPVNRHVRRVSGSQDTRFFTIGFVGSLKPWHGIEDLCRAFRFLARRHGAARLLLVGAGPMSDWVKRFALRSHLQDRIELTGKVPHSAVAGHLSRFHMAVAPYPQRERFYFSPLKLFEYMGSGLPVMATRTGQMEEILQHGRTAWLVPPGDPAALATGMARLAGDPALRRRLGQAARRVAFSRYRWQDVALRIMRLAGQRRPVCSVRDRAYPRSRRQEAV